MILNESIFDEYFLPIFSNNNVFLISGEFICITSKHHERVDEGGENYFRGNYLECNPQTLVLESTVNRDNIIPMLR